MKPNRLRTVLPVAVSSALVLSVGGLMVASPGSAEPLPTTYSARTSADLWHLDAMDAVLGDATGAAALDLSVFRVDGTVTPTANPRSHAESDTLAGPSATGQPDRRGAVSNATSTTDTGGPVVGTAPAGGVSDVVDFEASTLAARARWVGDHSCLPATASLTESRATSGGAGLVPVDVPGEDPLLTIPIVDLEVPPPSDDGPLPPLPDPGLPPLDIPGIPLPSATPTLPIPLPTSVPIPLPTALPTLPLPPLPTLTGLPGPRATTSPGAATQDVVLAEVAPAVVEQRSWLDRLDGTADVRAARSTTTGAMADATAPAFSFLDGQAVVRMTTAPKLEAYADGSTPGRVVWTPPTLTLSVAGAPAPYTLPTDGAPVTVNYSSNRQVVLTLSAGVLTDQVESANGVVASGRAYAVHALIENGGDVVLEAELFPMSVEAKAPAGGIDCAPVEVSAPSNPKLTLTGRSNGKRADRVLAKAIAPAAGARATLFKLVRGKEKKVASARLDAKGDRAFKVKDKNGRRPTTYVVRIVKTDLTKAARSARLIR